MSEAASSWQAGLRPWLVRSLLRPPLLARDVDGGWIGDLLGRSAWAEQRLPLLAAWTAQWSAEDDEDRPELPVVHARPLVLAEAPAAVVQALVQVATRGVSAPAAAPASAPAPAPAAAPAPAPTFALPSAVLRPLVDGSQLVARPGSPTLSRPSTMPAPVLAEPDSVVRAPAESRPGEREVAEPVRRLSSAELPRVVAAFQRERPGRGAAATPAAPGVTEALVPRANVAPSPRLSGPGEASQPAPELPVVPAIEAMREATTEGTTEPMTLARARPRGALDHPEDRDDLAHPAGPFGHVSGDISPPAAAVLPAAAAASRRQDAVVGDAPRVAHLRSAETWTSPSLPVPALAIDQAEIVRPRLGQGAQDDVALARPAARRSGAQVDDLSQSSGDAGLARAVLRPATAPAVARGRAVAAGQVKPVAPAAWAGVPAAPAREPSGARRSELPHAPAAPVRGDEQRPAPATFGASPVRSDRPAVTPTPATTPTPAATPPAERLDIEALIDTVHRRLARELGRARELRRTTR